MPVPAATVHFLKLTVAVIACFAPSVLVVTDCSHELTAVAAARFGESISVVFAYSDLPVPTAIFQPGGFDRQL